MYYSDYNNLNQPQEYPPIQGVIYQVEDAPAPQKKKRTWPKVAALCLSCAILGGAAGIGGSALWGQFAGGGQSGGNGGTTVYQGEAVPTIVNVANVNAKDPLSAAQIYATYVGSTVGITTQINTNIFGQVVQNAASGSGFVISTDGYIVTNYHVINEASSIKVTFKNGDAYDAKLVGGDEENDIAVLKIEASGLTPVVIGSSDNLVVGENVYAIGNPLGELTYSMTGGLVSALNRNVTMSDGQRMNYIQTDTAINSGNSGGALFNQYGQVVGIVSAKLSSGGSSSSASIEGLGFAIPIDDVWGMITDIMENGYVTGKPYMGVITSSVSSEAQRYGTPAGAYIMGVAEDSSAEKAGLKRGDIITGIDGTEITSSDDLINANKDFKAGESATLTVVRGGEKLRLTITFDEKTAEREAASDRLAEQIRQEQQQQYQQQQGNYYGGNGNGGFSWPFGW